MRNFVKLGPNYLVCLSIVQFPRGVKILLNTYISGDPLYESNGKKADFIFGQTFPAVLCLVKESLGFSRECIVKHSAVP